MQTRWQSRSYQKMSPTSPELDDDNQQTLYKPQRTFSQNSFTSKSPPNLDFMGHMPPRQSSGPPQPTANKEATRAAVFGSCMQVLSSVLTALYQLTRSKQLVSCEPAPTNSTIKRRCKILYVHLLEKAQKERGEYQGFAHDSSNNNTSPSASSVSSSYAGSIIADDLMETPLEVLETNLTAMTVAEAATVLQELVAVSFRNLRGSLVPPEVYTYHKPYLMHVSLAIPPSLETLVTMNDMLHRLETDERHCLYRLINLWHETALVYGHDELARVLEEEHVKVLSEASGMEFMASQQNNGKLDQLAINVLQLMVYYKDVCFGDLEYLLILRDLRSGIIFPPAEEEEEEEEEQTQPAEPQQAKAPLVIDLPDAFKTTIGISIAAVAISSVAILSIHSLRK